MDQVVLTLLGLLVLILVLPLVSKKVEENIELFLFSIAIIAGLITGKLFDFKLIEHALREPLYVHGIPFGIFQAVLLFGIVTHIFKSRIRTSVHALALRLGVDKMFFLVTFLLSILSSVISVIVASIILSEIALALGIDRRRLCRCLVYAAFSLGIGAILTPIGEPLATIVNSKLSLSPAYPGPVYLVTTFGPYVIVLCLLFSALSALQLRGVSVELHSERSLPEPEDFRTVLFRALRVYLFVLALVMLGESFSVLVELYFSRLSPDHYYLIGVISSFVDNATLAAAMVGPELSHSDVLYFVLSMLISGGFLVPGNIPNIIIASRVGIGFRDWAACALKIGVAVYVAVYLVLKIISLATA